MAQKPLMMIQEAYDWNHSMQRSPTPSNLTKKKPQLNSKKVVPDSLAHWKKYTMIFKENFYQIVKLCHLNRKIILLLRNNWIFIVTRTQSEHDCNRICINFNLSAQPPDWLPNTKPPPSKIATRIFLKNSPKPNN